MSIERQHGQQAFICDGCGESTEFYDREEFGEMVSAAKDAGWTIEKDATGEYTHHCIDCDPGNALERARRKFGL